MIVRSLLIILSLFVFFPNVYSSAESTEFGTVVSYHRLATEAGHSMLSKGGNAFDAFIATTITQYVLTEGVTSAAGPLGAVLYVAETNETFYLDGFYNNPVDSAHKWSEGSPDGQAMVIPGAIKALESLSKKYGRLSFATCLEPAITLAQSGFKINDLYAGLIDRYSDVLKKTQYGRNTFFRNNSPLKSGDEIKLPKVASFLSNISKLGSDYMYQGAWAAKYLELVKNAGGNISLADMGQYEVQWLEPLKSKYRSYEIATTSGRTFGGAWNIMALNALENWTPDSTASHYSESADDLELLIRLSRTVDQEAWIYNKDELDRLDTNDSRLSAEYGKALWKKVLADKRKDTDSKPGLHSYHVLVADSEGNVITGTNTINSYPWADGYFVEGIVIPHSGKIANDLFYGDAGERRLSPFSMKIVFENNKPRFATGAFNGSLITADMQFLVNLADYQSTASDAVSLPRFGLSYFDANVNSLRTLLSPRVSQSVTEKLEKKGVYVSQKPFQEGSTVVDTGYGGVLILDGQGAIQGDFVSLEND